MVLVNTLIALLLALVYYAVQLIEAFVWAVVLVVIVLVADAAFRWYVERLADDATPHPGPRERREVLDLSPLPLKE